MDPRVSPSPADAASPQPSNDPSDSPAETADLRAWGAFVAAEQSTQLAAEDAAVLASVRARLAARPLAPLSSAPEDEVDRVSRTRERGSVSPRAARARLGQVLVATACAAAGLFAGWRSVHRDRAPLTLLGRGQPAIGSRWLIETAESSETATFSDGSVVTVRPRGRAMVGGLDTRGATFSIERGALELDVVHRDDTRWQVFAGPFEVLVTGTRFVAEWDPDSADLSIRMAHGSVRVTSPCGESRSVAGTEAVTFHCDAPPHHTATLASARDEAALPSATAASARAHALRLDDDDPGPAADTGGGDPADRDLRPPTPAPAAGSSDNHHEGRGVPVPREPSARGALSPTSVRAETHDRRDPVDATAAAIAPTKPSSSSPAPLGTTSAPTAAAVDWRAALAPDNPRGAAAVLDPGVVDAVLREGEGADLIAAARALRAAGRPVNAQDLLHTARRRFQATTVATVAACEMGAAYYDTLSYATAALWLDKCVAEMRPEPTEYLLGLTFDANRRAGNEERTIVVARWYTQRFPHGPYALAAKATLGRP
jgi:hypothetical protein